MSLEIPDAFAENPIDTEDLKDELENADLVLPDREEHVDGFLSYNQAIMKPNDDAWQ